MDEITQNLKKQFDALPSNVQRAISDANLSIKLQEIVKNNKLMIDQAGKLETETILVLFGLEPLENYVNNLVKKVGLSGTQASVIAHDVNESIFKNIRETLKIINDGLIKEEGKDINEKIENPNKEDVLAGIENPEKIKNNETSISMSSLQSNNVNTQIIDRGVEVRANNLPEVTPEVPLPTVSQLTPKQTEPLHLNIPKVIESKPNNITMTAKIDSQTAPSLTQNKPEPFHVNIPPVESIVETKLNNTIVTPKETVIVPDKTKLPEKSKSGGDPYRESII